MKKILLLCLSAILAMAAGAATVTGKVVTPSKAPVAGATILFLNGDDSQFSATDDSGVFTIQNAEPVPTSWLSRPPVIPNIRIPQSRLATQTLTLAR